MNFVIREALPAEYEEIGELTVEVYVGDGLLDFGADDPYASVLRDAAARAAATTMLVAAAGERILGAVAFVADGPYADLAGPDEAEFRALAVRKEGRGLGVGRALVQECVARARGLSRRRLVLSTQTGMQGAHRLYERLGFVRAVERDWRPVPTVPLLAYELDLTAPHSGAPAVRPAGDDTPDH